MGQCGITGKIQIVEGNVKYISFSRLIVGNDLELVIHNDHQGHFRVNFKWNHIFLTIEMNRIEILRSNIGMSF